MDDRVLEKKKGLNLMTKILITALIPLILIVVLAGVSIHSVGSVVAKNWSCMKCRQHPMHWR